MIDSKDNCLDGVIELWFDFYYYGNITRDGSIMISIVVMIFVSWCIYFTQIKIEATDDSVLKSVSSVTLATSIFWNAEYCFEYLKLSFSRNEYNWLAIASVSHFVLIVYEAFLFAVWTQKFRTGLYRMKENLWIISITIVVSMFALCNSMLYNPIIVSVFWAGLWLPQIIHNIATGCTLKVDRIVCFLTTVQLAFPMYIMICSSNLFDLEPNTYWAKWIIVFVTIQIFVMYLQNRWDARLFVPRTVWATFTKLYLYVGSCVSFDQNIEWVIWLNTIDIRSIFDNSSDIYV